MRINGTDYPTPDGTCVRDYVHVDDLARAHVEALLHLADGGASLVPIAATPRASACGKCWTPCAPGQRRDFPIEVGPRRPGDPPVLVADSQPIRSGARLAAAPRRPRLYRRHRMALGAAAARDAPRGSPLRLMGRDLDSGDVAAAGLEAAAESRRSGTTPGELCAASSSLQSSRACCSARFRCSRRHSRWCHHRRRLPKIRADTDTALRALLTVLKNPNAREELVGRLEGLGQQPAARPTPERPHQAAAAGACRAVPASVRGVGREPWRGYRSGHMAARAS